MVNSGTANDRGITDLRDLGWLQAGAVRGQIVWTDIQCHNSRLRSISRGTGRRKEQCIRPGKSLPLKSTASLKSAKLVRQ